MLLASTVISWTLKSIAPARTRTSSTAYFRSRSAPDFRSWRNWMAWAPMAALAPIAAARRVMTPVIH